MQRFLFVFMALWKIIRKSVSNIRLFRYDNI
jgi:hypothetical protein